MPEKTYAKRTAHKRTAHKRTAHKSTHKTINKNHDVSKTVKSFRDLDRKITRRPIREFEIDRVNKILNALPKFTKFYNSLSNDEITAIKYYKGFGSYFQSQLLSGYDKNKSEKMRFHIPFDYFEENSLRIDLYGIKINNLIPFTNSLDIKDLSNYINTSYTVRIELLNRLDNIYNRVDCPKLTGDEILFRGMQANNNIKKLKVGDTYLFTNFISTTIDRNIAERFTSARVGNPCLFIFMNLKNIPFIYMPNNKLNENTSYLKFMKSRIPFNDLSEYTLPRNLEFQIEKISDKPLSNWPNRKNTFGILEKILKKKGYYNNDASNTSMDNNDTSNTEKMDIIDENIFAKATYYYCTFKEWKPRTPIDWNKISSNAEFIIDNNAIETWKNKETF